MRMMSKMMAGVLGLFVMASAAFAADVHWTNTAVSSGDFNLAANYDGALAGNKLTWYGYSGPPASLNIYAVALTMSANASITGWDQDYWNNVVNLDTAGFTLDSSAAGWNVAGYGGGAATNLIYGGGTVKAFGAALGGASAAATSPRFEVSGSGTTFELTDGINVGNNSAVKYYDGATIRTMNQYVYNSIGQSGATTTSEKNAVVEMSDKGTTWYNAGRLLLGYRSTAGGGTGNGTLTIKSGAKYYGGSDQILSGYNYEGTDVSNFAVKGTLNVQDAGSLFYATNHLYVGLCNTGVVTVANGGRLEVASRVFLGPGEVSGPINGNLTGTNGAAYGIMTVTGVGSTASVQRITTGYSGKGALVAEAGGVIETFALGINLTNGTVTVDDAYIRTQTVMNTGGANTFNFVLRNKAATDYYLDVGTTLTLGGTDNIYVDLSNFSGATGQYRLINYTTLSGTFDNEAFGDVVVDSGAYVGTTLENNTGDGYVYLNVIPEPASILLLLSGIVGAYKLRRRT